MALNQDRKFREQNKIWTLSPTGLPFAKMTCEGHNSYNCWPSKEFVQTLAGWCAGILFGSVLKFGNRWCRYHETVYLDGKPKDIYIFKYH